MSVKILTVDDSKTIRTIVKKAFAPYDCVMSEAENGVEGLAAAIKGKPDLIVLDITMPVMNGIEMLGKMKADPQLKSIPVIMLTAESGKENVLQIVKMGVKDYMVKPFKGEQLLQRAEKIIKLEPKQAEAKADDPLAGVFKKDGEFSLLTLPEKTSKQTIVEMEGIFGPKLPDIVKSGVSRIIVDLTRTTDINISLVKVLLLILEKCEGARISVRLMGAQSLAADLKGFSEMAEVPIYATIEEAKQAF
jgi:CheY-like chemotaxis protein